MRFKPIKLFAMQETGKDPLGNSIKEPVLIDGKNAGMLTQWTSEEIALLDREITRTQRKLLTDAPISILKQTELIRVDGQEYSIVDVNSDFIRWRLIHIKEHFT